MITRDFTEYKDRPPQKYRHPDVKVITSQRQWELDELIRIYVELQPARVLEIGSQDGGTLYHWLKNAPPKSKVVSVDIHENQPPDFDPLPLWLGWCPENVQLHTIVRSSHELDTLDQVKCLTAGLDFLFIDGDHSYEGAKQDFLMYAPLVRRGGIIAFHDLITPHTGLQDHIQVGRLFSEICHAGFVTRELYCFPGQAWGGIGVVYV